MLMGRKMRVQLFLTTYPLLASNPCLMEAVATMIRSGKMTAGPAEPARASKQDIILGSSGLAPLREGNLELFSFDRVVSPDDVETECADLMIIGRLV